MSELEIFKQAYEKAMKVLEDTINRAEDKSISLRDDDFRKFYRDKARHFKNAKKIIETNIEFGLKHEKAN